MISNIYGVLTMCQTLVQAPLESKIHLFSHFIDKKMKTKYFNSLPKISQQISVLN